MFKCSQGSDRAERYAERHCSFSGQVDEDCSSAEVGCRMLLI